MNIGEKQNTHKDQTSCDDNQVSRPIRMRHEHEREIMHTDSELSSVPWRYHCLYW